MKDFKAENTGNRIVINPATWKEATRLKQVILSEFRQYAIGIKLTGGADIDVLEKEIETSGIFDFIKNTLISIEISETFENALYDCLKHCTYKDIYKIDRDLFDNDSVPEAREDYYEIVLSCIEENLRPFLKSLVSVWKTHLKNNKFFQTLNIMSPEKM